MMIIIFTEIKTITVTGNWLNSFDSFIESVTIYCVREGPCSDIMGYINMTEMQTASLRTWTGIAEFTYYDDNRISNKISTIILNYITNTIDIIILNKYNSFRNIKV